MFEMALSAAPISAPAAGILLAGGGRPLRWRGASSVRVAGDVGFDAVMRWRCTNWGLRLRAVPVHHTRPEFEMWLVEAAPRPIRCARSSSRIFKLPASTYARACGRSRSLLEAPVEGVADWRVNAPPIGGCCSRMRGERRSRWLGSQRSPRCAARRRALLCERGPILLLTWLLTLVGWRSRVTCAARPGA